MIINSDAGIDMRDIKLSTISDRVLEKSKMHIPKEVMRKLTRNMFSQIFKIMKSDKDRIMIPRCEMRQIYTDYDVTKICEDLAEGKDVPTYHSFHKKNKLRGKHRHFIKHPANHLLDKINS